jgi:acetyltransferase-like isoleucine patch superfamily enzyme
MSISPTTFHRPVVRALRRVIDFGPLEHLLGLWLRRRFQRAGALLVPVGWPLPKVVNLGGRIEAENCAFFPGVRLECWRGAVIRIGNGTYLNRNVEIVAAAAVTIGRNCKIARDVVIMDTDQHALPGEELVARPVVIGDRVWIGTRAIVLKGVSIGNDCVVGAGAIVTKSLPPGSVAVGPAARVIRTLAVAAAPDGDRDREPAAEDTPPSGG